MRGFQGRRSGKSIISEKVGVEMSISGGDSPKFQQVVRELAENFSVPPVAIGTSSGSGNGYMWTTTSSDTSFISTDRTVSELQERVQILETLVLKMAEKMGIAPEVFADGLTPPS